MNYTQNPQLFFHGLGDDHMGAPELQEILFLALPIYGR